jgi:large subunit ribosomal protein L24
MANFKTGDLVKILSGDDKGKTGKVLKIDRVKGRVLVEGINMLTHFVRKTEKTPQGGMIKKEGFINLSKAALAQEATAKAAKAPKATKPEAEAAPKKKSLPKKA